MKKMRVVLLCRAFSFAYINSFSNWNIKRVNTKGERCLNVLWNNPWDIFMGNSIKMVLSCPYRVKSKELEDTSI